MKSWAAALVDQSVLERFDVRSVLERFDVRHEDLLLTPVSISAQRDNRNPHSRLLVLLPVFVP
jgi:hypothetical protein